MKISIGKKLILFLSLGSASIPNIYATANDITLAELYNDQEKNTIEKLLKGTLDQLKAVTITLEKLKSILRHGTIKNITKEQKASLEAGIDLMYADLVPFSENAFVTVNEASLKVLLTVNAAAIEHLRTALNNGFKELPPLDWHDALERRVPTEPITLESLEAELKENDKLLEKLTAEAKNVGLTWYNKAYRALDSNVIHPVEKYRIHKYVFLAAVTGAALVSVFWVSNTENQTLNRWVPFLPWLRDKLGWCPQFTRAGEPDTDYHRDHPIKAPGHLTNYIVQHTKGYMPIASAIFYTAYLAWAPEIQAARDYMGKKQGALKNFLMGGGYINKAKPEDEDDIIPKVTLKDLVGADHVKEEFSRLVEYIKDPESFDRSKLKPELGYLLTGPTRTGKSFSAEALAGEIRAMLKAQGRDEKEFKFITLPASFIEQKGIRWILSRAREAAPCVLFIDEIDLLGLQRAGGRPDRLSEFLTTMSGCLENNDLSKPVIIVAATNKPENLDVALRQRGRFGKEIRFEYPSTVDRREYFTQKLGRLALNAHTFNIESLIKDTEGCSYEQINALIRSAFERAKNSGELLTQAHLDEALDREIRNIIMVPLREINATEKRLIAIHQAGLALAVMLLNGNQKLSKVTIRPFLNQIREESVWDQYYLSEDQKQKKISYGRIFTHHDHDTINFDSLEEKINTCKVLLAGHAAETILLGSCGYSYHPEASHHAFDITKSIVMQGIDMTTLPDALKTQYLEKALALRKTYEQEISALLASHKDELKLIADALQERETLSLEDINLLLHPEKAEKAQDTDAHQSERAALQSELGIVETPAPAPAA